jgi:Surface antigen
MNRLDCAKRASAISLLAALIAISFATPAEARKAPQHTRHAATARHAVVPVPSARPVLTAQNVAPAPQQSAVQLSDPTVSIIAQDKVAQADTPTIVHPGRRILCVEFARLASGIALFGDAKTWWNKAREAYAQLTNPTPGSVMVFADRKTMRSGHVAVVKRVVSEREVLIDHANWGRDGRIYLNAPVVDISAHNDWSVVKVWNFNTNQLGTTPYNLKGFIAQRFAAN